VEFVGCRREPVLVLVSLEDIGRYVLRAGVRTCISSLNDVRSSAGTHSKLVRCMGDDKPSGT